MCVSLYMSRIKRSRFEVPGSKGLGLGMFSGFDGLRLVSYGFSYDVGLGCRFKVSKFRVWGLGPTLNPKPQTPPKP